jgi:hypothetical protein
MPTTPAPTSSTSANTDIVWPSTNDALATLKNAKLIDDSSDLSATKLASIIFRLSNNVNSRMKAPEAEKLKDEMQALAKLVRNAGANDNIRKKMNSAITSILAVSTKLDEISIDIKGTNTTVKEIQLMNDKVATTMKALPASVEESATKYRDALLSQATAAASTATPTPAQTTPQNPEAAKMIAQQEILLRQMLLDFPKDYDSQLHPSLTASKELITSAILATNPTNLEHCEMKAVQQLANGGIIIELATPAGVNWIRNVPENKIMFEQTFGHGISIKSRSYRLLVRGVNVSAQWDSQTFLWELEEVNEAPKGSFAFGVWWKPEVRRRQGQTIAYACIHITDPDVANDFITRGIIICGKRCRTERIVKEAPRCLNCQLYVPQHFARDCPNKRACSTCSQDHNSQECTQRNKPYCMSCKTDSHASWDRGCQTRKNGCQKLDARRPEDTSPYFYSASKPWTHPIPTPRTNTQQTQQTNTNTNGQQSSQTTNDKHHQNSQNYQNREWIQNSNGTDNGWDSRPPQHNPGYYANDWNNRQNMSPGGQDRFDRFAHKPWQNSHLYPPQ